jgi:AcrR family transcriptional regulator
VGAERLIMSSAPLSIAPPPRRERNASETRRRILDAAEVEFAAKGFDGARLGSIARAADAQSALIHHYFEDKAGLYQAVLARALDALSAEGWDILAQVNASIPPPPAPPKRAKAKAKANVKALPPLKFDIAKIVGDFVESMLRFYATHMRVLSILTHDAHSGGPLAGEVMKSTTQPVFEAIVALLERLQRTGELRPDFDARHVCISGVAMASWPFQERLFVAMVFPIDVLDPRFVEARRRDIVAMLLDRILPR